MIQQIFQGLAVYFIIWWVTLFTMLPIGLRTQAEDKDVILGTVESAPTRFRALRVFILTTLVSGVVYGTWYVCSTYLGLGFDSLPKIGPRYT